MKKSLKLQEERAANITSLESIHTLAETQERELTTEESTNVDELIDSIDSIDVKIERALKSEKLMRSAASVSGVSVSQKIDKDLEKFTRCYACGLFRKNGRYNQRSTRRSSS
jgi:hypothetical protein